MADAAQEFLDKQLSKNKFTAKQQARLDASGGPAVVDASDGVVPEGEAYSKYGQLPGQESSDNSFYESGWRSEKDSGEIGWSDTWNEGGHFQQIKGDGPFNAEYEERFNALGSTGSDVDDHGAGWKSLKDMPTMGSVDELKALSSEWEKAGYDVRVQDIEGHDGVTEANIAVRKGSGKAAEPAKKRTPIEHSPEVKQATERVRAYEDNVMSGKTSENLFGDYSDTGLDLNKGSEAPTNKGKTGIGTQGGAEYSTSQATYNFLDAKKSKVKEVNNIQPAPNENPYGAY